ncbi:hypothetical protein J6590_099174, partial [Homalodisca vitripennis]
MKCLAFLVIRTTCCLKVCKTHPTCNKSSSAAWDYSKKKGADTSIRGNYMLSQSLQDPPYVQQVFFRCMGLQQEERSRHEDQG